MAIFLVSCSAPARYVTKKEYDELQLAKTFRLKEKPETILRELNSSGEVIFRCWTKGEIKRPCYIKIMATSLGLDVKVYPREE